jgi:protein TonB
MFEQTILTNGKKSRRFWTTCLGVTSEAVVVGLLVVAPMVWPQALPLTRSFVDRYIPTVPPPPPGPRAKPAGTHVEPQRPWEPHPFTVPMSMPPRAVPLIEEPPAENTGPGVLGSTGPGTGPGVVGSPDVFRFLTLDRPAPVVRPPEAPAPTHASAPKPIPRIHVGGEVQAARLLVSVKPAYPTLAKTAGISGTVELEAVIGVDGRLAEIHVKRGHPLLVPAAVEAVRQWIYKPTYLNGDPVEVSTTILVNFVLGR